MSGDRIEPTEVKEHPAGMGGTQELYRFENGYGASVIQTSFSYGGREGRRELAVLRFRSTGLGIGSYQLAYDTPITDDVLGHLDDDEVQAVLARIRDLAPVVS